MNSTLLRRPTKRLPTARTLSVKRASPRLQPGFQPAAVPAAPTAHDELVAIKRSLEALSLSLNSIDPQPLSEQERAIWIDEMNRVDLAIARVRVSLLEGIVAEFEAQIPAIQAATAQVEADLAGLQQAVDIINVVAGALGVLEQIIGLAG
jgi:hypothetical protein